MYIYIYIISRLYSNARANRRRISLAVIKRKAAGNRVKRYGRARSLLVATSRVVAAREKVAGT